MMKKVLAVEFALLLLMVGVMFLLLHEKTPRADITEAEVVEMVESIAGDASITPGGNLRIRRSFGLNAADYDLAVYYMPVETMDVCEILFIRGSESQLASVQSAMEARVDAQITAFEGYGEHQTELLKKSIIRQYGNYICLIVAEEPDQWIAAVEEMLEV